MPSFLLPEDNEFVFKFFKVESRTKTSFILYSFWKWTCVLAFNYGIYLLKELIVESLAEGPYLENYFIFIFSKATALGYLFTSQAILLCDDPSFENIGFGWGKGHCYFLTKANWLAYIFA